MFITNKMRSRTPKWDNPNTDPKDCLLNPGKRSFYVDDTLPEQEQVICFKEIVSDYCQ